MPFPGTGSRWARTLWRKTPGAAAPDQPTTVSDAEFHTDPGSRAQVTLSFSIESGPAAPARARRVLAELQPAVPDPVFHDLGVVITEVVSNAVRFGPRAPIGVLVKVDAGGGVFGEVTDGGSGGVALDHHRPYGEGGLGLQIVDALCSAWGTDKSPSRVWFRLDPHEHGPAP